NSTLRFSLSLHTAAVSGCSLAQGRSIENGNSQHGFDGPAQRSIELRCLSKMNRKRKGMLAPVGYYR
ncbi:MAG: hypothetical protein ACN6QU_26270, partial [Paraburkholderia terricola]